MNSKWQGSVRERMDTEAKGKSHVEINGANATVGMSNIILPNEQYCLMNTKLVLHKHKERC